MENCPMGTLERWPESIIFKFLKKLHSIPCLWNTMDKNFSKTVNRAAGIYELTHYMNLPGFAPDMITQKVLELKSTYIRERRRMFKARSDKIPFQPRFRWYRIADALWGRVIPNLNCSFNSNSNAVPNEEVPPEPIVKNLLTNDALTLYLGKAVNAVRHMTELNYGNEFDAFGRSVALQLKNLSTRAAYEVQADIQTIITKKKIEVLLATYPLERKTPSPEIIEVNDDEAEAQAGTSAQSAELKQN